MRVCFFTSILALLAETASAPVVSLKEINLPAADTNRIVAIVDARLIDGKGGAPSLHPRATNPNRNEILLAIFTEKAP